MKNVVSFNVCTRLDHINDISNAKYYLTHVIKIYQELFIKLSENGHVSIII